MKWLKNEKGAALVYVMLTLVVLSIFGAALLNVGLFETKVSILEKTHMEAYYLAKTGAAATAQFLSNPANATQVDSLLRAGSVESSATTLGNGSFKVRVSPYNLPNQVPRLRIEATGSVVYPDGVVTEKESVLLDKNILFTKAVFASGNVINATNSLVNGEVEAVGTVSNTGISYITQQPVIEHSTRSYPDPTMPNTPEFEMKFGSNELEFPGVFNISTNPHMPNYPKTAGMLDVSSNLTIQDNSDYPLRNNQYGNFHYASLTINSSKTLYFDIQKDIRIYVDAFYANNANIEVMTSGATQGKLFIYVKNSFYFKGEILSPPETFYLIGEPGSAIEMQTGNQVFNGYIYAPKSNVDYKSGTYSGAIICHDLTLSSGGTVTYDGTGTLTLMPELIGLNSFGYKVGLWGK